MLLKRQRETKPMVYQHKHRDIGSHYNFFYLEGLAGLFIYMAIGFLSFVTFHLQ